MRDESALRGRQVHRRHLLIAALMRSFSLHAVSLGISRERFLHHGADLGFCFPLQKISFGFGSMHLSISIGRELRGDSIGG